MRRTCGLLVALIMLAAASSAGEPPAPASRVMAGWFNVATPEGWTGRRYMDGKEVFAEAFDSNGDGRIDIWRFYRRGLLSSEERDTNANGRVDFQSKWEGREGRLTQVLRDTRHRGVNDLEIESTGPRTWVIREDRNGDGVSDRILFIEAPPNFFETLGLDLARQPNVIDHIPMEFWRELWTDDGYVCDITAYYRYNRGVVSQYGEWDGERVVWRRAEPGFQASSRAAPAAPAASDAPVPASADGVHDPYCVDPGCDGSFCRIEPSDAPITDVRTDYSGVAAPPPGGGDPYAAGREYSDPYSDPYSVPYSDPRVDPYSGRIDSSGVMGLRDRTRYEGLPPGDSAARSVPARMRPPGTSRR